MRHYEIVFLVHPDQSGQVEQMVERYQNLIKADGGVIHRFEDWGRRPLAYPIKKIYKAHYILMNVEMHPKIREQLEGTFRYNDAIIRYLILQRPHAITATSPILLHSHKSHSSDGDADKNKGKFSDPDIDIVEDENYSPQWQEDQQKESD